MVAEGAGRPFERGPFVQVAAFCDKVLREADGVLSLIRVVDQVTQTAQGPGAPAEMPEFTQQLTFVLALKSGASRGRHEVTITVELPSGETLPSIAVAMQMEGENRGANLISQMAIPMRMEGLYWFRVQFDGTVLTRVPLEVRYARLTTA